MDYLPLKLISTFYHYFVIFTNTYCFFGYGYPSFTLAGPCCIHPSLIEPGTTSISTFDLSVGEWAMRLGILSNITQNRKNKGNVRLIIKFMNFKYVHLSTYIFVHILVYSSMVERCSPWELYVESKLLGNGQKATENQSILGRNQTYDLRNTGRMFYLLSY